METFFLAAGMCFSLEWVSLARWNQIGIAPSSPADRGEEYFFDLHPVFVWVISGARACVH
jgi:hypothetical protein